MGVTNIFQDAYFGRPYRTRDGRKALYLGEIKEDTKPLQHILNVENFGSVQDTNSFLSDGTAFGIDSMFDIVSEWQEEISEEELDKLAENIVDTFLVSDYTEGSISHERLKNLVKAGYHKDKR